MSTKAIDMKFEKITPTRAKELLTENSVNRRLRGRLVTSYAEDMRQGLWKPTGEAIKISRTGQLLDGQHRLNAIIEAKKPLDLLVVTGLPDEAQALMDQGAVRSASDALQMHGFQFATLTATVARWLLLAGAPGPHLEQALRAKASTARVLKTAQDNPDCEMAAKKYATLSNHVPGSPTGLCYSWLHTHRADASACEEFFEALVDMRFYPTGSDPRRAGLRALQRMDRDDAITNASKEKGIATVSVLTRTWNAWRKGEDVETIALRQGSHRKLVPPVAPI